MLYFTLALGMLIGGYIQSINLMLFSTSYSDSYIQFQIYNNLSYIVGLVLAYVLVKRLSLKVEFPTKIPLIEILAVGVWVNIALITCNIFPVITDRLGYVVYHSSIPYVEDINIRFIEHLLTYACSLSRLVCLFAIFLEASRNKNMSKKTNP